MRLQRNIEYRCDGVTVPLGMDEAENAPGVILLPALSSISTRAEAAITGRFEPGGVVMPCQAQDADRGTVALLWVRPTLQDQLDQLGGARPDRLAEDVAVAKTQRNRWFADSPLEEHGFEPSVPRDMTNVSRGTHVASA
jgi:hypothetical protein